MAYTTLTEVRALSDLDDSVIFTDAKVADAIAWATILIDDATGTAWETKSETLVLDGTGCDRISTGVANLQGITSCTSVDSDGNSTAETVTAWKGHPDGLVIRDEGAFPYTATGRNITLTVTHGATTSVPDDIAWCARTLARQYLLQLESRVPDNALQIQNEWGTVQLAQPGGKYGPTSLPQVNAILKRRNHRPPTVG